MADAADLRTRVSAALGALVTREAALGGGCVGDVRKLTLSDGRILVAKVAGDGGLAVEGFMLRDLARRSALPVPAVHLADDDLLLMDYVAHDGDLNDRAQADIAWYVAALHGIAAPAFGFERDTVIGGLPQPNAPCASWIGFFRDRRLLHMAGEALRAGRLPARLMARIETLAGRLERWIGDGTRPSLIHGDLWSGNLLVRDGRLAAVIDPALYFADAEIELAFGTLFGTFGPAFFDRYRELRPIAPGFFEERRDLYNLYPLLVHVRLFGGAYLAQVERTLIRYLGR